MCRIVQSHNLGLITINYFECKRQKTTALFGENKAQIAKLNSVFNSARQAYSRSLSLRVDLNFIYEERVFWIDDRFIQVIKYVAKMAIKKMDGELHYESFEMLLKDKVQHLLDVYNNDPLYNEINKPKQGLSQYDSGLEVKAPKIDISTVRQSIISHYNNTHFTNPQQPKTTMPTYNQLVSKCQSLFAAKLKDYGASWACMRMVGYVEQLLIKANRISTIQQSGAQKVADSIEGEFIGLYNYAIMACMKIENPAIITNGLASQNLSEYMAEKVEAMFVSEMEATADLMQVKNHDYGQAWRLLSIAGITDFILTKIYRLRQIYANGGEVKASEKPIEIFRDIANYAIFALILMSESKEN